MRLALPTIPAQAFSGSGRLRLEICGACAIRSRRQYPTTKVPRYERKHGDTRSSKALGRVLFRHPRPWRGHENFHGNFFIFLWIFPTPFSLPFLHNSPVVYSEGENYLTYARLRKRDSVSGTPNCKNAINGCMFRNRLCFFFRSVCTAVSRPAFR